MREWPKPNSISELWSFMSLLQYFKRFIRGFSEKAAPLANLTQKSSGIKNWDDKCEKAFSILKQSLVSAPILISPQWDIPFKCHTDAS